MVIRFRFIRRAVRNKSKCLIRILTFNTNNFTSSVITVGVDVKVNPKWVTGAAVGYGYNRTTLDGLGSVNKAQQGTGSSYLIYKPMQNCFVDALIGYGNLSNASNRWSTTDVMLLTGSRNADVFYGALALNGEVSYKAVDFFPFIRTDLMTAKLGQYAESGSFMALNYNPLNFNTEIFSSGLILSRNITLADEKIITLLSRIQYLYSANGNVSQNFFYSDFGPSSLNYNLGMQVIPKNAGSLGFEARYKTKTGVAFWFGWLGSWGAMDYQSNDFKISISSGFGFCRRFTELSGSMRV